MTAVHPSSPARFASCVGSTEAERSAQLQCQNRLQQTSYPELHSIRCEFQNGVLILRGNVRSFFLKQLAQETIRNVEGIAHISNAIRVEVP